MIPDPRFAGIPVILDPGMPPAVVRFENGAAVELVRAATPLHDLLTLPEREFDRIIIGIGEYPGRVPGSRMPRSWPLRPLTPTAAKPADNPLGYIIEGRVPAAGDGKHR